jgi:hypothetical protein
MNTTRTGKIARLPKSIREELNRRIENGEKGLRLVDWLNAQPEVQAVLHEHFGGRPIKHQNFSDWKHGGYQDWLNCAKAGELARELATEPESLADTPANTSTGDRFATIMMLEIYRLSRTVLDENASPEEQWKQVCSINAQVSRLRRDDCQAGYRELQRQRLALSRATATRNPATIAKTLQALTTGLQATAR